MDLEAQESEPCSYCGGEGQRIEESIPWGCSFCNGSGRVEKEKMIVEKHKALDSAHINNAIAKLPKGHNWGWVRLEMGHHLQEDGEPCRIPLGDAICIDCGELISHTTLGWLKATKLS